MGPVLKLGATVLFPECVRAKFRRPYASISEKKIRELLFARFKFRELFFVEVIFVSQKEKKKFQLGAAWAHYLIEFEKKLKDFKKFLPNS